MDVCSSRLIFDVLALPMVVSNDDFSAIESLTIVFCRTHNITVSSTHYCMPVPTDAVVDGILRLRSCLLNNRSVDDGNT